jgi:ribosomal protein S27AE
MPFGNQEIIRCPRCNQAVFHAESIPAAGKQWHKTCYRCGMFFSIFSILFIFLLKIIQRSL